MGKYLLPPGDKEGNKKTLAVKESTRVLTAAEFHRLSEVSLAIEWFVNI